jgi:hypothetical protein
VDSHPLELAADRLFISADTVPGTRFVRHGKRLSTSDKELAALFVIGQLSRNAGRTDSIPRIAVMPALLL